MTMESGSRALPVDLQSLDDALGAIEADARKLVDGLSEAQGTWRTNPGSWSVAECLDHLATGHRVYLAAMESSASRALSDGSQRRGPARPGIIGGWFVRYLEPPASSLLKGKAPRASRPRPAPPLGDAFTAFLETQSRARAFLRTYADIDLSRVRFANPFMRGVRFSLATGLHVIAAHDRRHLWQAWRVRREAEAAGTNP
jgi:hypothetical protein